LNQSVRSAVEIIPPTEGIVVKSFSRIAPVLLLALPSTVQAQQPGESEPYREYRFLFGEPYAIEEMATAGLSLNRVFADIYLKGLGPVLPEKMRGVGEVAWSIFWTFTFTMWPHDFGHRYRAREMGGEFIIHGYAFPFPDAEMRLPPGLPSEGGSLSSIGGFEVNLLMKRQVHMDFYRKGYAHADELIHAFIQETHYPAYALLLTPANPKEASTWTDTRGDPVESTLSVYEGYYGRSAIRGDGSVDPDLVRLYRESVYLSVLWTLLDPMLYRSVKAFGLEMDEDYGRLYSKMYGNERFGWIYGTEFHATPLGYELYLNNYLRLGGKLYSIYLKGGRPYKNYGIGVQAPELIRTGPLTLGAACDLWDQDIYGSGVSVTLDAEYRFSNHWGLLLKGAWKNRGYLVGRRIEESTLLLAGFGYRF
jgi:hypothetical protein